MLPNSEIVKRAEAIAARDGGLWTKHLNAARADLQQPKEIKKVITRPSPAEEALRKKAAVAELRHQQPGIGDVDPDRRIEVGECETEVAGRVRVAISVTALSIHGVHTLLADIDKDLADVAVASAASFAAAETAIEQVDQRRSIGLLMDAVMRRHEWLTAAVKEAKDRERFNS